MKHWSLELIKQKELKKQLDKEALLEYGFHNDGELRKMEKVEIKPLSAGIFNMVRQFLP